MRGLLDPLKREGERRYEGVQRDRLAVLRAGMGDLQTTDVIRVQLTIDSASTANDVSWNPMTHKGRQVCCPWLGVHEI